MLLPKKPLATEWGTTLQAWNSYHLDEQFWLLQRSCRSNVRLSLYCKPRDTRQVSTSKAFSILSYLSQKLLSLLSESSRPEKVRRFLFPNRWEPSRFSTGESTAAHFPLAPFVPLLDSGDDILLEVRLATWRGEKVILQLDSGELLSGGARCIRLASNLREKPIN